MIAIEGIEIIDLGGRVLREHSLLMYHRMVGWCLGRWVESWRDGWNKYMHAIGVDRMLEIARLGRLILFVIRGLSCGTLGCGMAYGGGVRLF